MKIGDVEISGPLALAPMAGVTDAAFRLSCRDKGAALTYTEMVSSRGLVYHDAKTKALLFIPEGDHPCAAQIFGSDPDVMGEAAAMARECSGADIIDLNMGCPVGKIVGPARRSPEREPEKPRAHRLLRARAGCPEREFVGLGRAAASDAVEFAKMGEAAGASPRRTRRTRGQMSGAWGREILRDIKSRRRIPVVGNGDGFPPRTPRAYPRTGVDL